MAIKKPKPQKDRFMGSVEIKRGKISRDEAKLMQKELAKKTPIPEIAQILKRSLNQTQNYIRKYFGVGDDLPEETAELANFKRELRSRTEWKRLPEYFDQQEINWYEELYCRIMKQFKEDIQATEEIQVFSLIDCTIFLNRHKKLRKEAEDEILRIDREIEVLRTEDPQKNHDKIAYLLSHRQVVQQNSLARTKEFTELQTKQEAILQKLRSTREQRIKTIENSKQSFVGLIKALQDKKLRDREGRQMELRRIATDQARANLIQPHRYVNGEWDQPLLTWENVFVDDSTQDLSVSGPNENKKNEIVIDVTKD